MSSRRTPVMLRATACLGAVAAIGASAWRAAPWEALQQTTSANGGASFIELGDRSAGLDRSSLANTKQTRTTLVSAHSGGRASSPRPSTATSTVGTALSATSATVAQGADAAATPGATGNVTGGAVDLGTGPGAGAGADPGSVPAAPTQAPATGQPVYFLMGQAAPDPGESSQGAKSTQSAAPTTRPTSSPAATPAGRSTTHDEADESSAPQTTRARTRTTTKAAAPTPTPTRSVDR